jgi:predicted nucleic acid-binding protein
VLDASVALAWVFLDEETEHTRSLLRTFEDGTVDVPQMFQLEIVNSLLTSVRRNRIEVQTAIDFLDTIARPEIRVWDAEDSLDQQLLYAREVQLTVYDASYVRLAERRGLPLATLDKDMQRAAKRVGVALL